MSNIVQLAVNRAALSEHGPDYDLGLVEPLVEVRSVAVPCVGDLLIELLNGARGIHAATVPVEGDAQSPIARTGAGVALALCAEKRSAVGAAVALAQVDIDPIASPP